MLKATAITGKLGDLTIYTGVVECWDKSFSTTKPLWTQKLMIDRIKQDDAFNDASNEIELLMSISKHPNTQF